MVVSSHVIDRFRGNQVYLVCPRFGEFGRLSVFRLLPQFARTEFLLDLNKNHLGYFGPKLFTKNMEFMWN